MLNLNIKLSYKAFCKVAGDQVTFDPPVYLQRYNIVTEILNHELWKGKLKKVVEFGCAEMKFLSWLKNEVSTIEHILQVDIDQELLKRFADRATPLLMDYLNRRPIPLKIDVYKGDIQYPDDSLLNSDAVIAIELIEHLFPDTLEAVPFTVFGHIRPKIAIFTTPNCEANEIFPDLQGFRHDDHKFEWTRDQFRAWSENICTRYPDYDVQLFGIGPLIEEKTHLGCVSQGALFVRRDLLPTELPVTEMEADEAAILVHMEEGDLKATSDYELKEENEEIVIYKPMEEVVNEGGSEEDDEPTRGPLKLVTSSGPDHPYEFVERNNNEPGENDYILLFTVNFPFHKDDRSPSQKIFDDAVYHIGQIENYRQDFYDYDEDYYKIPLDELVQRLENPIQIDELKAVLKEKGYETEGDFVISRIPPKSDSEHDYYDEDDQALPQPVPFVDQLLVAEEEIWT